MKSIHLIARKSHGVGRKPGSYRFLISVAVATAVVALRANANAAPAVQSEAPWISITGPAPALYAATPYAEPMVVRSASHAADPPAYSTRDTLANCLSYWDAETHMSRTEWLAACQRTQNGTEPTPYWMPD